MRALKGLFVELHYDPQRFHPHAVDTSVAVLDSAELLRLEMLDDPGMVSSGQIIAAYETSPGVGWRCMLLRVQFDPGPAALIRNASTPPATALSKAQLFYTAADGLFWHFSSAGITVRTARWPLATWRRLGLKFGQVSAGGPAYTSRKTTGGT